jgi:hypothetical protein
MAQQHPAWEEGDEIIAHMSHIPTHAAQQWAIEANKNKPGRPHDIPEEYQHHSRIFLESAAERFPPSQATDMTIKLKPGAPESIDCKIYPLS